MWNHLIRNLECVKALDIFLKLEARKMWDFFIRETEEILVVPGEVTTEVSAQVIIVTAMEGINM